MEVFIDGKELRKAMKELRRAESQGFKFCRCVFKASSIDEGWILMKYSDLNERASEDPKHDWGRFQGVSRRNKFVKGKLVGSL